MTIGQLATANVTLGANGSSNITAGDFTTTDGTALGASDAVIARSVIHEESYTLNRIGDPNGDATFEISVQIESPGSQGERISDTIIITDVAGVEVSDDSGNGQEVTVIGERVSASKVFVEQNNSVADSNEVVRTIGGHGQEETVLEVVHSVSGDVIRRHDPDDNGTFELNTTVESRTGAGILNETWLAMKDETGRTNAEFETAIQNTSGGGGDFMILGTIGVEGL